MYKLKKVINLLVFLCAFPLIACEPGDFSEVLNTKKFKGKNNDFCLHVNPSEWILVKDKSKEGIEDLTFCSQRFNLYGNLYHKNIYTNEDELLDSYTSMVKSYIDVKVLHQEKKNLKGKEVTYVQLLGEGGRDVSIIFDAYLYSQDNSTLFLSVMAQKNIHEDSFEKIESFLNGIHVR